MKSRISVLNAIGALALFLLFLTSCGNEKPDVCLCACLCQENEMCLYDECYLTESVHSLGGITVVAPNSYVGYIESNLCLDTLIFYNDTSRSLDDERFGLIANVGYGVLNVLGSDEPFQSDSNEYYSQSVVPLCYLNGEGWYSNLHFIIYPDSVWMELGFWTLNSEPGVLIDSCTVMFYKKK